MEGNAPDTARTPPRRPWPRRVLRAAAWSMAALLVLLAAVLALGWWWIGTDSSLAAVLHRAARYLPAGQTLEAREVSGSLRRGGAIGHLRWQSPTMAVEVEGARIGWSLGPLLQRRVQLGEVHAARIVIEPRGPKEEPSPPPEPLTGLALPVQIELPFRVDDLQWKGPPPVQATGLAGRYVFDGQDHRLKIDGVDLATPVQGHYSAEAQLQGAAPMALKLALDGRLPAPLEEGRSMELAVHATADGTLAGADARLAVQAQAAPTEQADGTQPMDVQVEARIAPWAPQPVIDALAKMRRLDVALLWPQGPRTLLTGEAAVEPDPATGAQAWKLRADIVNAEPGPWDEGRLPVQALQAGIGYDGRSVQVEQATVHAGHGRIEAHGAWSPAPDPWRIDATLQNVRPGELHTGLAGAPISGRAKAQQRGEGIDFDVALQAQGGGGTRALNGLKLERALAQGRWADQVLDLAQLRIDAERASLQGKLELHVADQAGRGDLRATLPGGSAQFQGRIAPTQGGGELSARVDDAAALQQWLEGLPGLGQAFGGASAQGSARLQARWQGGWRTIQQRIASPAAPLRGSAEPTLNATLETPRLVLRRPEAQEVELRGLRATLDGSLANATLALRGEARQGTRQITLDTRAGGGLAGEQRWRLSLAHLRAQMHDTARGQEAPWTLALAREFSGTLRAGGGSLELETTAGGATLEGPVPGTVRLDWEPLRLRQSASAGGAVFRLQTKGRMRGLPMAWSRAFGGDTSLREMGISGDLVFDGDWDIDAADQLRAQVRVARAGGDLRLQAGEAALVRRIDSRGTGTKKEITTDSTDNAPSTPAGLRQAELRLDAQGEAVRASLAWDSERAGRIDVQADTRLAQRAGGWQWAPDAPLGGRVKASLPQLGVWSMLAPPGWRVSGTLEANATLAGTRGDPRWNGTLAADRLSLKAAVEGLDLRDGRLRAQLAGNRLVLQEFVLHGGPGSSVRIPGRSGNLSTAASEAAADGGRVSFRGEAGWGAAQAGQSGLSMDMRGEVQRLRALVRSDRQVTVSGDVQARLAAGQLTVRGKITTDRAVIILPDETAPGLGSDVVVHSAARAAEQREQAEREARARERRQEAEARPNQPLLSRPPDIAVDFDLGRDFAVQGRGITTRLEGTLNVTSRQLAALPRITGEVRTVQGQYRAYGQALDVESGIARFNGPVDNPQLDILALRPNITQRAGVQVTGTAQAPRVKLYSDPALPDAQTLSWVVLGRASATSGGEALLMQQAALALLGGLGKGAGGGGLASRFGLDEIGFKGPGSNGGIGDAAVTLGKRLSDDFYVTYERSLAGTLGTLFIFYDLTRNLTLRGQAGLHSGVDLIYTVKYD
ncbi:translocation/assembly module TamB domain-containing protein [Xenophilus azovorans]|uniref:translocation/assembly module TamB domain-containing protein n=1 Tax=Xenophilus azovorans TaxID=151755 RepID=UPI00056E8360|nr:translocation/assembly module TamB domain-containing protein [Xenophilus azovorans]